jgi:hypothetical protein
VLKALQAAVDAVRERDVAAETCRRLGRDCSRVHIEEDADGGETKLPSLVLLCRHHHRLVHERGFGVRVLDDGALRFSRPDGRGVPVAGSSESAVVGDWRELVAQHERRGLAIDARSGVSLWAGERMDYNVAIDALGRLESTS